MYAIAADLSSEYLGLGLGRKCLVVGSAIFEVSLLRHLGWDVTYLDIRDPPRHQIPKFIQADASQMPVDSQSFDAVSSNCVLAHIGLGRYGDPLGKTADQLALNEMRRVLKPGGKASITFGNVTDGDETITIGSCHRIYTKESARRMALRVGFLIGHELVWNSGDTLPENDYITMFLRR